MQEEEKDGVNLKENQTFARGEDVPDDGKYVCVPCGFNRDFKAGEKFGECSSCITGGKPATDDDAEYADGLEMWEKM